MTYAYHPGAGFRRFDGAAAEAERAAQAFRGLPEGNGPGQALAAFKRAAAYLNVPPSVVQLVDVLFAWTKPEDWRAASTPIVWPRNDKLARKLGLKVRQVQNLLDRAIALRLISHKDSPNGNRGGARGPDGTIKWAYGIVLSPIGTRIDEFRAIAERGAREDEEIDALRRRLASARRRTASLAQAAVDASLQNTGADEELALAQSAARQMRYVRDVQLLTGCVEQIEQRGRDLEGRVAAVLLERDALNHPVETNNNASADVTHCIDSTTTTQPQTAKAVTRSGLAEKSSGDYDVRSMLPQSEVEEDLEKHGVDLDFIESIVPELCGSLDLGRRGWGELVQLAERLADQHHIHRHAWHEACRIMGQRGAAASVIATVRKYQAGEVERPGAYLRGMSGRAAKGELNLGRTFHGLKDLSRAGNMKAMQAGGDPRSIGQIARAVSRQFVLSGRSS
ncbi:MULTISPECIES: plasmid replication protein RepC [unclassified Sphingomonas]|uniref:plasmid replication protein RepC n=1 Tax=unclassified Sphingomonas TaxID=196159 RepID=UPI00070008EC|nr:MULTISPECIES: plasmid replication protein RepC [unclassified Sphingomonas]KRB78761.1 replication protein C [Sphingomonas sp. Root710]KRB93671.1 replication protein C [Sphingomonas sp. Root720]